MREGLALGWDQPGRMLLATWLPGWASHSHLENGVVGRMQNNICPNVALCPTSLPQSGLFLKLMLLFDPEKSKS